MAKYRSPAQRAATARNYTIFRLHGISAVIRALAFNKDTKELFTKPEIDDLLRMESLTEAIAKRVASQ